MIIINAEDVPAVKVSDLLRLPGSPLEEVARVLLGANKTEGVVGRAVRRAAAQALSLRHGEALAQLLELLPADLADLIGRLNLEDFTSFGCWIISDGRGRFGLLTVGRQAVIGTSNEITNVLSIVAMRGLRRAAADAGAPAAARYEAAALARPRLRLLG